MTNHQTAAARVRGLGAVMVAGIALIAAAMHVAGAPARADDTVAPGGAVIVNQGLVGVGRLPGALRDKFGETFGSGSGMAFDRASWTRTPDGYRGTLYLQPDRGYNISGTIDYQPRINKLAIDLRPADDPAALAPVERQRTVRPTLVDSIMLTDAAGAPLTSLDPVEGGIRPAADGFPPMPQAVNGRVSLDAEAIVRLADGSFFVSDEYGPYIYRFSAQGRMLAAIRPPDAFIPRRNGRDNFSSNNPGPGAAAPVPPNPQTGRQNNQGFEGLSLTPDQKFLVAVLQSATRQDGGDAPETRQNTRMLVYDLADVDHPRLVREHVVPLPAFVGADGKRRIAAQSDLLALDATRFLLICRDSDNGYGMKGATSQYRRVVLADVSAATNIAGSVYDGLVPVAPGGVLAAGVAAAGVTPVIDINDNAQLGRFGLHNGPPNDADNLTEKWESLGLVPALDPAHPRDFFLFVGNDNDFMTQNGFQAGAPYRDPAGVDLDTMFLVYRVTLSGVAN